MKLTLRREGENRGWPNYLLWGRVRTSTFVLIVAFLGTWWLYETYAPPPGTDTQVVPPGFVPDPAYTWVPRTNVRTAPPPPPQTTPPPLPTTTTIATTTPPVQTTPTETTSPTAPTTPTGPGDSATTPLPTPTTLPPGATPQTTAENRSGIPTTNPTVAPPPPGGFPTPPLPAQ